MKYTLISEAQSHNDKICIYIPVEVIERLNLQPGDKLEFSIGDAITISIRHNLELPEEVFLSLLKIFKPKIMC
ncbi:AbrB/MazE/SpoVT family DNA-binding domain-containing protein [Alteromonas portus]|uniref:AbrB/MazE/SpoVT family DNA-binding domain-containing protein n=1 Tax=Alteromonas portus TaxID=2565549 RepID=UPI003BF828C1